MALDNKNYHYDQKLHNFWFVCAGAIPGALLRWQFDNYFFVNILGSLMLGLIYSYPSKLRFKSIFALGFCGSFTSFSGWIFNCFQLISNGLIFRAIAIILSMFTLGLISFHFGYLIGNRLFR